MVTDNGEIGNSISCVIRKTYIILWITHGILHSVAKFWFWLLARVGYLYLFFFLNCLSQCTRQHVFFLSWLTVPSSISCIGLLMIWKGYSLMSWNVVFVLLSSFSVVLCLSILYKLCTYRSAFKVLIFQLFGACDSQCIWMIKFIGFLHTVVPQARH